MNLAVIEPDAVGYLLHIGSCNVVVQIYVIDFLLLVFGVSQLGGQFAIVGEQQHTGRVAVKPAHRIDALAACPAYQIHYRLTVLRIVACRDVVLGLVKQYIYLLLQCDRLVIKPDDIAALNLGAELRDDISVDRNQSGLDIFVCVATGTNSCVGEKFVEPYQCIGIEIILCIIYTFVKGWICSVIAMFCSAVRQARALLIVIKTLVAIIAPDISAGGVIGIAVILLIGIAMAGIASVIIARSIAI